MFTFTPKFLHNLKHFPITFLSLLDYNFYTEVLMKTILSQFDCTIYCGHLDIIFCVFLKTNERLSTV